MSDASNPLRRFENGFQFSFPIMPWEADADVEHLYRRERIRIPELRVRVWEERQLVRELNEKFSASDATQLLLRPAWLSLGYVDSFFLSEDALRQQRSPAQLSKWLDQAEEYLAAAITQRKFYEGKLERYPLTVRNSVGRSKCARGGRLGGLLQAAARLLWRRAGAQSKTGNIISGKSIGDFVQCHKPHQYPLELGGEGSRQE
jgi:hypothetical protein